MLVDNLDSDLNSENVNIHILISSKNKMILKTRNFISVSIIEGNKK